MCALQKGLKGRAEQACEDQAGFLGDGPWGRAEKSVPGMEKRVFKGPEKRREQILKEGRSLTFLERRERGEGEGRVSSKGVWLRFALFCRG